MPGLNGKSGSATKPDQEFRPSPSTAKVYHVMEGALTRVAEEAAFQAGMYMYVADVCDRDKGTAIRLGHLVDASECLEISLTYLAQLKAAVAHRLHLEDAENIGF